MVRGRRFLVSGAAVLTAVVLVAAGCGSSSKKATTTTPTTAASNVPTAAPGAGGGGAVPGVTANQITIGQIADISGPVPGLFQGTAFGIDAWAAYVNSTGGIDGRKIVIDHKDSALSCTAYSNGMKSLATATFAAVGSSSALDVCGVPVFKAYPTYPIVNAIDVNTSYLSLPNIYSPLIDPPGSSTTYYLWVKNKYGAAATQKLAVMYSSPTALQFQAQLNAAESVGYRAVYTRGTGQSETNFTSDVLRMKSDGVEIVDMSDFPLNQVADFVEQAAQQNFHPDAMLTSTAYDSTFFKLIGNPSYAQDVILTPDFSLYLGEDAGSVPEIDTMTTWLHKTHPGAPMSLYVATSWASGLLFQQALEKLGSNPTQAGLLTALKGTTSFNADGLFPTEDVGGKIPPACTIIVGAQNGKFVRIDPSTSGFLCNGTYVYYHGSGS